MTTIDEKLQPILAQVLHRNAGEPEFHQAVRSHLACTVDVFGFKLVRLADHWPEMTQRVRRWYAAEAAASLVAEPELATLISSLERASKTHA